MKKLLLLVYITMMSIGAALLPNKVVQVASATSEPTQTLVKTKDDISLGDIVILRVGDTSDGLYSYSNNYVYTTSTFNDIIRFDVVAITEYTYTLRYIKTGTYLGKSGTNLTFEGSSPTEFSFYPSGYAKCSGNYLYYSSNNHYARWNTSAPSSAYKNVKVYKLNYSNIERLAVELQIHVRCNASYTEESNLRTRWSYIEDYCSDNTYLSNEDKETLRTYLADKNSDDMVAVSMAKYDLIVYKYGVNNFLNRNIPTNPNLGRMLFDSEDTTSCMIVVIATTLALICIGGYFKVVRKKK